MNVLKYREFAFGAITIDKCEFWQSVNLYEKIIVSKHIKGTGTVL
jgi:hypothetical protein